MEKKAEDLEKPEVDTRAEALMAESGTSEARQTQEGQEKVLPEPAAVEEPCSATEAERKTKDQEKAEAFMAESGGTSEAQQEQEELEKVLPEGAAAAEPSTAQEVEKKAEDLEKPPAHTAAEAFMTESGTSEAQQKQEEPEKVSPERAAAVESITAQEAEKKAEDQEKPPVHAPPDASVALSATSQAQQKPVEEAAPKQEKPPMDAAAVRAAAQKAADVLSQLLPKPLEYEVREALPCYSEPDTSSKQLRMLDVGALLQGYPGGGWVRLEGGKGWAHIGRSLALTCLLPTVRARYLEAMDLSWPGFPKVKPGVKAGP